MWRMRSWLVGLILTVEAAAVALVVVAIRATADLSSKDILLAALLCGLGLAHTEIVIGTERTRRQVNDANHVDLTSVWIFAGAVILPVPLAVLVVVVLQAQVWLRTSRLRSPFYRAAFTTATMVLACIAASSVMAGIGHGTPTHPPHADSGSIDLLVLVLAMVVFTAVNSGLIAAAIAASTPQPDLRTAFGQWDDNFLEIATLALGALAAVGIAIHPVLVLAVLPPLIVLHKAVLVRHLIEAATIDGKTGLLNAAAWHSRAEAALRSVRGERPRGVLVLDLDHFKTVNDAHGHLAGDRVLVAVAGALRAEVRDSDLVGRFGGEEFVVLLAAGKQEAVAVVAERIRGRVANLQVEIPTPDGPLSIGGLTVSIGGAVHPVDGDDIGTLLYVADAALYAAKRAGRNLVRMGSLDSTKLVDLPIDRG